MKDHGLGVHIANTTLDGGRRRRRRRRGILRWVLALLALLVLAILTFLYSR